MRNCSEKAPSVSKSNDEGCEDDKPLSARVKVQMSSTVQIKISVFASSSKKRPLVDNIKRNGSKPKGQSSQSPSKRHLEKGSSSNQSFVKRPKLLGNAATPDIKGKNLDACKPLKVNQATVREENSDGDDHLPIASRMRSGYSNNKSSSSKTNASKMIASSSRKIAKNICVKDSKALPFRDGQKKWTTLVHNGVLFPPPYKCHGVKILYQGKPVDLTPEQEEVATMFAKMRETEYYNKPLFRENFWNDWRELLGKNHVIRNLDDCDFSPIYEWYMQDIEIRKQMSAEEKRILKEEKLNQEEKYMWAVLDGVKEKAVNFRVEPPGLFRARGDHPKMGKLKKRIRPCDITINIGKDAPIPECPTPGERWKEIKHDTTVTWLAFWNDPINPKVFNYAFLAASSALKRLREACTKDLSDKDATKRETEVATYLIDKLSLRAGDEKVTIISDHDQRTVSESNGPQAERLAVKIEELREKIEELDIDLDGTEKETPAAEWTSDFFIVEPVKGTDSNVPVFTEPATELADVVASEVPKETAISPESVRRLEREKPPEHRRETKEIDIGFPLQSLQSLEEESSADKGRVLVSPTAKRAKPVSTKEDGSDDDDDVPISKRLKSESSSSKVSAAKPKAVKGNPSSSAAKKKVTKVVSPPSRTRTVNKNSKKVTKDSKYSSSSKSSPSSSDGQTKWTTLEHNGVIFPPPYKPHGIKILYKGKPVDLTIEQEEVATMFAVMKETDYYTKPQFRENFWNDWRKLLGKKHVIQKLDDCDFTPIYEWHLREKEKKKQMSTEEKKALKEEKLKLEEKYMWAVVDGVKEKVGNFRVEPPGLFRGRGEHPKMGKLKKRIHPSDITMNIGKGVPVPECPIPGEKWKDVKHDNTVTWLAFWNDPINPKEFKYVFLAASSAMKGLSDKEKYEKARNLTNHIDSIRATYTKNFTSKDVAKKQIAVATYLIDKLALRAGNEKDDDEADTVGCCTLKVGNVECIPPNQIKFDFLGKDSIRYENTVVVEPLVYKAIGQFQAGKSKEDDLFDELDTSKLNAHLKELVPGLTAKVFRTYNASFTLDEQLNEKMGAGDVTQKVVVYQQANKKVAIICNHQRAVSKSHSAQIEKLDAKLKELQNGLGELRTNLKRAKEGKPPVEGSDGKKPRNLDPNAWEKKIAQQEVKIEKMKRDMQTKEDLKTVALGTSKINYLDPRITVAWCKRNEVPIEKIFTKSLLEKFSWAMDAEPSFRF
ncbi:unnamed protein product [Brassica rapa subsp. trilocularis]